MVFGAKIQVHTKTKDANIILTLKSSFPCFENITSRARETFKRHRNLSKPKNATRGDILLI